MARQKVPKFPSKKLARAFRELIQDVEEESLYFTRRNEYIVQGFDYVVAVQKIK